MLALVALASALIADAPISPLARAPAAVQQAYDDARAVAGRSPADQVRLAYWCEAHGLTAERMRHLAQAVLADPTNAAARGLLGLVARDGRWMRPDAVAVEQQANPATAALLAEYDRARSATPDQAAAQFALAVWADERGLKAQARAHFTATIRLDPTHEQAWKRLGYTKRQGRWQTEAQTRADQTETAAQRVADRRWKSLLEQWKEGLGKPSQRAAAEAQLASLVDPRAVRMVARIFGTAELDQPRAAQLLGQIDSPTASLALAYLAAFGKSTDTRRIATETLRGRDAREYAEFLVGLLEDRIKYEITPVPGPGKAGVLHVEGPLANVDRIYTPAVPQWQPGDRLGYDRRFGPVVYRDLGLISLPWLYLNDHQWGESEVLDWVISESLASRPARPTTRFQFAVQAEATIAVKQLTEEAQKAAKFAQKQLLGDARTLDRINGEIDRRNERVLAILQTVTGQPWAAEREAWTRWYVDLIGYRSPTADLASKATVIEQVPTGYEVQYQPVQANFQVAGYSRISCFGAGTPVQTSAGARVIESLAVGDLVLTQSTSTGALGYQPILATHHNPPSTTFRIKLGGEEIVSSAFHRFWVAGRGWVMARHLQAGDRLRTLGGVLAVESIAAGTVEPVFNLDVAEDANFFAGQAAVLVHDNTLPDPRLVPFDAPPARTVVAVP